LNASPSSPQRTHWVRSHLSETLAVLALVVSVFTVWYIARQVEQATEAYRFTQQVEKGTAVIHFTAQFSELLEAGDPLQQFVPPTSPEKVAWQNRYWSLLGTEFYFFHHGLLPEFMFSLWVANLAELYRSEHGSGAWESHRRFMEAYSVEYPEMLEFFAEVHLLAETTGDNLAMRQAVSARVRDWIAANRRVLH
jgi:hypothetical protein